MTIDEALAYGREQLHTSATPSLDARLLLANLLQVSHSYLISHNRQPLTPRQQEQYEQLVQRAQKQEPIPYIIGSAPFFDFEVVVTADVLIPRPETEQLVETAVAWAKKQAKVSLVDVGTGSGCIAIALAKQLPEAAIQAVDISPEALLVAQQNAQRLVPDRIQFQQGSLLQPLTTAVDGIIANLPYVTDGEWTALDDGVKWYEPSLALKGGADGLDIIRQLLQQAIRKLSPHGAIFLEIGWKQGQMIKQVAREFFPEAAVSVLSDLAGHDRIVTIKVKD
jgi:release factor glutamine methyltransferase